MQFYRTVLFLPVIISLVSTGFIWTLMLSSKGDNVVGIETIDAAVKNATENAR